MIVRSFGDDFMKFINKCSNNPERQINKPKRIYALYISISEQCRIGHYSTSVLSVGQNSPTVGSARYCWGAWP